MNEHIVRKFNALLENKEIRQFIKQTNLQAIVNEGSTKDLLQACIDSATNIKNGRLKPAFLDDFARFVLFMVNMGE